MAFRDSINDLMFRFYERFKQNNNRLPVSVDADINVGDVQIGTVKQGGVDEGAEPWKVKAEELEQKIDALKQSIESGVQLKGSDVEPINVQLSGQLDSLLRRYIEEPIAIPKGPLVWTYLSASSRRPRSIGVDGYVYGDRIESGAFWRSGDGLETFEDSYDFSQVTNETPFYITRTPTGYVAITRDTVAETATIWYSTDFASGWTDVVQLTDGYTTEFNVQFYNPVVPEGSDVAQDCIGLVGEYSLRKPSRALGLYLTRDGGQSWIRVLDTVNADTNENSHWHHANYDPFRGRIYAASGDGPQNARLRYSDDLGKTWKTIDIEFGAYSQPTLIVPMHNRVIIAPDSGDVVPPQVLSFRNDDSFDVVGGERFIPEPLFSVSDHVTAGSAYGKPPYVYHNAEVYLAYWNGDRRVTIVGTGDGGASWHRLYGNKFTGSGQLGATGIVGPDKTGHVYSYACTTGPRVAKAPMVEWVRR